MPITEQQHRQALEITQSLVQIPSLAGDEKAVVDRVKRWMLDLGYQDVRVDACGNVIGALHGSDGPTVMYDSHVDTVPAGDETAWTYAPFGGAVVGERIYGRGTSDMKGALAASLVGLAAAHADGTLRGTALVSATVGEEHIEGLAMGRAVDHYHPDLVVICEATALKLATAQRGRAEINITTYGKSAHASSPHIGINAMRHMARLVNALDDLVAPTHPTLGQGILEPTTIISSPYPNVSVIPWRCDARYDRRTLVDETAEDVLAPIQAVIDRLHAEDDAFQAEAVIVPGTFTCYTGLELQQPTFAPAWAMPHDGAWVRAAAAALGDAEHGHYSFCTNGSYSLGRAGIPTLGFGPGFEHTAHITDEYLDFDQLYGAVDGYYRLGGMAL
ncbi:MAG: YgeY family selenium metabolism-linked hydrolase [Chloroflexota bacterium]